MVYGQSDVTFALRADAVRDLVIEVPAVRFTRFSFSSSYRSNYHFDCSHAGVGVCRLQPGAP
jgi:hypothetical protein